MGEDIMEKDMMKEDIMGEDTMGEDTMKCIMKGGIIKENMLTRGTPGFLQHHDSGIEWIHRSRYLQRLS
jgi:hypothetical protein